MGTVLPTPKKYAFAPLNWGCPNKFKQDLGACWALGTIRGYYWKLFRPQCKSSQELVSAKTLQRAQRDQQESSRNWIRPALTQPFPCAFATRTAATSAYIHTRKELRGTPTKRKAPPPARPAGALHHPGPCAGDLHSRRRRPPQDWRTCTFRVSGRSMFGAFLLCLVKLIAL